MIARTPPRLPARRASRPGPRRKPAAERFAAVRLRPEAAASGPGGTAPWALAALLACGAAAGFLWPRAKPAPAPAESVFLMEEELPPPPRPLPPPPDPAPPRPPEPEPPPPPPSFGLEEDDLGETGDLAVAAGNTVMKEAEPELAPPPPPLPSAPVFVDQAPRILAGAPPEYPPRALDRNLEATVVALIAIDTNGVVTEAAIERSGGLEFDGAVLASAYGTRFQPPTRQGRKVPARFRRPYAFKLE